jgi:glycerate kinase
MHILIAPTAYKGTLSPLEAARAIANGIQPEVSNSQSETRLELFPVADGGNGWLEAWAFHAGQGTERIEAEVRDPLRRTVRTTYLMLSDKTAILESASACGLQWLKDEERNPMHTSTEGVGDLIRHACEQGAQQILLGLGGSATNDAGVGALRALGFEFPDARGKPIPPGGEGLLRLARIVPAGWHGHLTCACDVQNPLYGAQGAARVYALQKGALPGQVRLLDEGLRRFAKIAQRDLGVDISGMGGAGAAGGLAAGLRAGLGALLTSGIRLLLARVHWETRLQQADVLVTGEGKVDAQTGMGKGVGVLIEQAVALGKRVWLLAGRRRDDWETVTNLPGVRLYVASELFPDASPAEALQRTAQICLLENKD